VTATGTPPELGEFAMGCRPVTALAMVLTSAARAPLPTRTGSREGMSDARPLLERTGEAFRFGDCGSIAGAVWAVL
jgi:hypothetical protein